MAIDWTKPDYPSNVLTVIIRDDSPMIHCNDAPTYRSVRIELTPEQMKQLALRPTSSQYDGKEQKAYYEIISKCFIEEREPLRYIKFEERP